MTRSLKNAVLAVKPWPAHPARTTPNRLINPGPPLKQQTWLKMMENVPLIALSGFRSPDINPTELGTVQPTVVICAGDINISIAHTSQEFSIAVHHNFPPFNPITPYGVRLCIPLNNLASIFFLDHGNHGRSIRIRLISQAQAFKLDQFATVPGHKRYMLDELARPVLLYPWHQNDHFDLLGILQGREVVAQLSPSISMEYLVDWGARLKEAAATLDGTAVQVLFDNIETGRVSQLETRPLPSQHCISISKSSNKDTIPNSDLQNIYSEPYPHALHKPHNTGKSSNSEDCFGIPTPPRRRSSVQSASTDHQRLNDEDYWTHRQRVLRPNSPRRYYRPQKRKSPAGEGKGKAKEKSARKRRNRKAERRKQDEGRLNRPSTPDLPPNNPKAFGESLTRKPEVSLEVAVAE